MTVLYHGAGRYSGLASDSKPTPSQGHTFVEVDTGQFWVYDGSVWQTVDTPSAGSVIVYNEDGLDVDFRWESDGNANLLFLDGGNNRVGIGTNSPNAMLDVNGDLHVRDGFGIVIGHTTSLTTSELEVAGTAAADSRIGMLRSSADTGGALIQLIKSRSGTLGTLGIVENGDELGLIVFRGDDGTDLATIGASIRAIVSGTPDENDMPTDLVFGVTADGAGAPSDRMRLFSNGRLGIGVNSSPFGRLHVRTSASGASAADTWADEVIIENNGDGGVSILTPNSNSGYLVFGDPDDGDAGGFSYNHSTNTLNMRVNGSIELALTAAAAVFSGYIVPLITDTDGAVEGALWYDASENKLKFYNGTAVETITSSTT